MPRRRRELEERDEERLPPERADLEDERLRFDEVVDCRCGAERDVREEDCCDGADLDARDDCRGADRVDDRSRDGLDRWTCSRRGGAVL